VATAVIQTPIHTLLANLNLTKKFFHHTLLVKYFFLNGTINTKLPFHTLTSLCDNFYFTNRYSFFKKTNLVPVSSFNFTLQKKILKIVNFEKFRPNIILWYYNTLIRFLENCSGKKVLFKLNPFIENSLTFTDIARSNL